MSEQLDVLKIVAIKLEEVGIPYMISGSVAMNFYAQPRMTRDIDIVIEIKLKDVRRLHRIFAPDFYVDEEDIRDSIRNEGLFNIIHNKGAVKIDFIIRKNSLYRREEFRRRRKIDLEGTSISVVAPEDLVLSKLDWAKESRSELQLRDVRNLLSSVTNLDFRYIRKWATELCISDLLAEAQS